METWQTNLVLLFLGYSFFAFLSGIYKTKFTRNTYGISWWFFPIGAFVWGDAAVFGLFWSIMSIFVLFHQNWLFLTLIFALFWAVRSMGETIYWFIQQFTPSRNTPKNMIGYQIFQDGDSIWFIYQTVTQCICIISIVSTIYFATMWIRTF